jgi:hypothetical protein
MNKTFCILLCHNVPVSISPEEDYKTSLAVQFGGICFQIFELILYSFFHSFPCIGTDTVRKYEN